MRPYKLGLYEKSMPVELAFKDKLLAAKEAGYDFLEISVDETDEKLNRLEMSALERREMRLLSESIGTPVKTMCLSGHRRFPLGSRSAETRARGMEIMEKAVVLAADLSIRVIQLAGYDVYYEERGDDTEAYFAENLAKAVELAAREGVVLGFETMETSFMNTTEKAMRYVGSINSPYLQIYPDCGNLTNAAQLYNTDVIGDLKMGAGHIAALHLKETLPGIFREVPFGKGHVEFGAIIEAAVKMGVRLFVTEFWYTGNPRWKQDLHQTREMFIEKLNRWFS